MLRKTIAFLLMFGATLGAAAYASLTGKAEMIHFWVAVPAGYIRKPITVPAPKQPIRMTPIGIDLDRRGFLKRWLQPNAEGISTHWITNTGGKPVRIRMELTGSVVPVSWEVKANFPYDPQTHTFTRPLQPGQAIPNLAIDWVFQLPCAKCPLEEKNAGKKCGELIYDGGLRLSDADTGEMLTFVPIKIGRNIPVYSRRAPR